ncbi:MAG: hypothetical protein ACJASP_001902, partial [Roseivirga sp.]
MKKISLLLIFVLFTSATPKDEALVWGQIGHRAVGHIADGLLSKKSKKNVKRVLGHLTLATASTWM